MSESTFLPFALPDIGPAEEAAVIEVLRSGWLTTGRVCEEFEQRFAKTVCADHALTVSSCTAGLHLALEACGVGPGDKVVTSPYTFTATAEVVRYLGAEVVFCDIDPRTRNLCPERLASVLEDQGRVKVVLPVHFGGLGCDMEAIEALARRHGCRVVEDAAHALPSKVGGRMIGSIGDITVFSFYVTKTLSTGEGGMVTTADRRLAERMRTMRLHGIDRDVFNRYREERPSWYYEITEPGYKYNMMDICAALGLAQLDRLESMRARRAAIAARYSEAFGGMGLECPPSATGNDLHAWHLYVVGVSEGQLGISRDQFIAKLAARGIGTSVHFIPLHLHPYWRDRYQLEPSAFPGALDAYAKAVSLPIYSRMTDQDVERVIGVVGEVLGGSGQ